MSFIPLASSSTVHTNCLVKYPDEAEIEISAIHSDNSSNNLKYKYMKLECVKDKLKQQFQSIDDYGKILPYRF